MNIKLETRILQIKECYRTEQLPFSFTNHPPPRLMVQWQWWSWTEINKISRPFFRPARYVCSRFGVHVCSLNGLLIHQDCESTRRGLLCQLVCQSRTAMIFRYHTKTWWLCDGEYPHEITEFISIQWYSVGDAQLTSDSVILRGYRSYPNHQDFLPSKQNQDLLDWFHQFRASKIQRR